METSAHSPILNMLIEGAMLKRVPAIHLRPFKPGDEGAFRSLNEAWIAKYFVIEAADRAVLEDPVSNILEPGGHIFMALADDTPVGCCALLRMGAGEFELAKMAVLESERGRGIGRKVLEYAIAQARKLGAERLYLETNRKLANAIHLYESVGFRHVSPEQVIPSPYARANVFMEMEL
jgi:GNAT superfamily N-acetyltransferase